MRGRPGPSRATDPRPRLTAGFESAFKMGPCAMPAYHQPRPSFHSAGWADQMFLGRGRPSQEPCAALWRVLHLYNAEHSRRARSLPSTSYLPTLPLHGTHAVYR